MSAMAAALGGHGLLEAMPAQSGGHGTQRTLLDDDWQWPSEEDRVRGRR
jgi:hypothetical protein